MFSNKALKTRCFRPERHQVGVIVRVGLDEGGLTGKITPETTFEEGDFRNRYFRGERKQQVYERVQKIASDLGIPLEQMAETALRYALSHPAVSTVIVGMRSVRRAGNSGGSPRNAGYTCCCRSVPGCLGGEGEEVFRDWYPAFRQPPQGVAA
jgi:hypothetical protein